MASNMPPEGILKVRCINLEIGSVIENVEDGINVHVTYKIIKNLGAVASLHGKIDV